MMSACRGLAQTGAGGSLPRVMLVLAVIAGYTIGRTSAQHCADLGSRYLVAFPQNTAYTDGLVELELTTPSQYTTASVQSPRYTGPGRLDESVPLYAHFPRMLTDSPAYRISGSAVSDRAVIVSAREALAVAAYSVETNSCDGFLALPVAALGTEYFTVCYWPPSLGSQITVAALDDNTEVTLLLQRGRGIRITFRGRTYQGGDVLRHTLNAYEVLQVQDTSDLSGTLVRTTLPAALYSGNAGAYVQAYGTGRPPSALVEQLPPVGSWGHQAYVVPFPDKPDTVLKIVAERANTRAQYMFEGEMYEWRSREYPGDYDELVFSAAQEYLHVVADGPILVALMAPNKALEGVPGSQTSAMTLVPTDSQMKNRYYFSVTSADTSLRHYLLLACPDVTSGHLTLNGDVIDTSRFTPYPRSYWDSGELRTPFVGGAVPVTPGVYFLRHSDPSVMFSATLYGSSDVTQCTYAHPLEICHQGPKFSDDILGSLPGELPETTTDLIPTTETTTQDYTTTEFYTTTEAYTTTEDYTTAPVCPCSTVFLTASSRHRDLVGFYGLHTCQTAGQAVYVRGDVYVYYAWAEGGWVVRRGLGTGEVLLRRDAERLDGPGFNWQMEEYAGRWFDEPSVSVECVCDRPACLRLHVTSINVDHTFPGEFHLGATVDSRPLYVNLDAAVILTFTRTSTCSYWAVKPLQGTGALAYAYDISPRPQDVRATWRVAKAQGWEQDPSLRVQCLDSLDPSPKM